MAHKIIDESGNVLKHDGKEVWGIDFDIELKQTADDTDERRIISMIGSTPSVDRDNDIIVQSGWDTKAFKNSSPVLWAHNHSIPAIAKITKFNKTKDALTFDEIEFPKEGVSAFSDMIFELIKGGFLKAGSVGFLPIKSETRERTEEEEKNEPQSFCPPTKFLKQELLEFSIVNVGSNRDALVTHLGQKGFKTNGKIKIESEEGKEISVDVTEFLNKLLCEDKRVIPHKKYPLDPEESEWNGPEERREADVPALRLISTWFDAEKPEVKSSYKLPHHRAQGHNTVLRGVRAAMGALLGARGGVDIPEGDRKGTHSHLAAHLREFDKEVPEFRVYEDVELKEMFPEEIEGKNLKKEASIEDANFCPASDFRYEFIKADVCDKYYREMVLIDGSAEKSAILMWGEKEGSKDLMLSARFHKEHWTEKDAREYMLNNYPEHVAEHLKVITDNSLNAEILRLKDGGFLFDFNPTKEAIKNDTRYSVEFTSSTERCGEANLQEWDEESKEWKTIQTIKIQDIEQKAGAVLNKANKNKQ
jgi:hypothetical protein